MQSPVFDGLLVTEYRTLRKYARRLTANGAEADDLVQTVVARILAKRSEMVVPDNVAAWLRTVLFRAFVDGRRQAHRRLLAEQSIFDQTASAFERTAPGGGESPRSTVAVSLAEASVIIASLPRHYREAYELYTFQHLSYEEIAARLEVPPKTVGSRLNRARSRLRALVQARHRGHIGRSRVAG